METWRALEECVRAGKVRWIGVSNFNKRQLERVISEGKIRPVVLQIEMNPFFQQDDELLKICRRNGILVEAYSPLQSSVSAFTESFEEKDEVPDIYKNPVITEIAQAKGMTNAQLSLRFLAQCYGVAVLVKSSNEQRMRENWEAIANQRRFELTPEELERLRALDLGERARVIHLPNIDPETTKNYPFPPAPVSAH